MNDLLLHTLTLKLPDLQGSPTRVTLDAAVDRLAELQLEKRRIEAEETRIRKTMLAVMDSISLERHRSPSGHQACTYDSRSVDWISERVREILTKEEQEYCLKIVPYRAIRIS